MKAGRYIGTTVALALLLVGCSSPVADNQAIQSGSISASAGEEGALQVALDEDADLLSDAAPGQIVHIGGEAVAEFEPAEGSGEIQPVTDERGSGRQLTLEGTASLGNGRELTRTLHVTAYENFENLLVFEAQYASTGTSAITIDSVTVQQYELRSSVAADAERPSFWTFQGASYPSRPDWVLPLGGSEEHFRGEHQFDASGQAGFHRYNYLGMNASDYGGGIPMVSVWTPESGLAIGHLSNTPELVALPVRMANRQTVRMQVSSPNAQTIEPGESVTGLTTFVQHHEGDYYGPLSTYADLMAAQGVEMPSFPDTAYEPIWCAWGYGRNFETENILATIPKVQELGLDWVVLDDGWQVAEGEWRPNPERFPEGDASMRAFVDRIHEAGLKAKLWWVPMAADPGSRVDEQHEDWLLRNEDGSTREISWWDANYLCPAVPEVRSYTRDLIDTFINDWGYDGLKIDGQNLNAVPPCFNESHKHLTPSASVRAVPQYFQDVYDVAMEAKSSAVVELCPCGDAASFHNMPFNNQPVASDPTSSWQIRSKGKTFKALMGPSTPYYGDHVELSDGGDDFASSVGIGAVVGTKFTWAPDAELDQVSWMDRENSAELRLTDEREAHWEKWIGLYEEKMLPKGTYRGDLYDIGYDLPETHAIAKGDVMYYSFYAEQWDGPIEIRGLDDAHYEVHDYVNDQALGTIEGPSAELDVSFTDHLLIQARPVD